MRTGTVVTVRTLLKIVSQSALIAKPAQNYVICVLRIIRCVLKIAHPRGQEIEIENVKFLFFHMYTCSNVAVVTTKSITCDPFCLG